MKADAPRQNLDDECETVTATSTSAKKLKSLVVPEKVESPIDCNIIVNTSISATLFEKLSKCPICGENIVFQHVKKKKGIARFCDWTDCVSTSKTVASEGRGLRGHEISVRICPQHLES